MDNIGKNSILTKDEIENLCEEGDVHRLKYKYIDSGSNGYDSEFSGEIQFVIFKDVDTDKLYKFTYLSNNDHGIYVFNNDIAETKVKKVSKVEYE